MPRSGRLRDGAERGGQTTEVHALTELPGRPVVLRLSAGNVSDIALADTLVDAAPPARWLIAGKGDDADRGVGAHVRLATGRGAHYQSCGRERSIP